MFLIILLSIILHREFSALIQRSKDVLMVGVHCVSTHIQGKIVIEGPKSFEEHFNITYALKACHNRYRRDFDAKSFAADLEENSTVSVELSQNNGPVEKFNFVWRYHDGVFYKGSHCLFIRIIKCSSNVQAQKSEERINCQSDEDILPVHVPPMGHLGLKFNPNSEPDFMVKIDSTWETEVFKKRDYYIDSECIGLTPVWDEKHLRIQIGNEIWSQLNIKNPGKVQIIQLRKIRLIYIPNNRKGQSVYHYILVIKNIDDRRENHFLTDEIIISLYDKKLPQHSAISKRTLSRVYPGDRKIISGQIEGIPEAKRVMVQIKAFEQSRVRDISVIPVIYKNIEGLNQQLVISGLQEKFVGFLVFSKKPILSLAELYLITIKTPADFLRFQFCVKSVDIPCHFKDTEDFDYYQQVYAIVNPIKQLVLKSGNTECLIFTNFQNEETTEFIDISGIRVEVDIKRMPKDEEKVKWSWNDDYILRRWSSMSKNEKLMIQKNLSGKATNH